MDVFNDTLQRIAEEAKLRWNEETRGSLKVSVMGQTGVGKSTLINSLFDVDLNTDPERPGTTKIEMRSVEGKQGHKILFYDLPGIGESQGKDEEYLKQYKQMLLESDVAIWAIHADSRSVSFDRDALHKLLETVDKNQQIQLMSKIIFVLTKVDLLTPVLSSPWILYKVGDEGVFETMDPVDLLIKQKEQYFQESFIKSSPFKDLIKGQTYCSSRFNVREPKLRYSRNIVYYDGLLDEGERNRLIDSYRRHKDVFKRLYDNYRVIPCSSRYKYNLNLLMRVVTDKLASKSTGKFGGFLTTSTMDRVPFSQAVRYVNIVRVE